MGTGAESPRRLSQNGFNWLVEGLRGNETIPSSQSPFSPSAPSCTPFQRLVARRAALDWTGLGTMIEPSNVDR